MTEVPPLGELDPEEWARLHYEIRADQRARRGRWDYLIHPFEVIYATALMVLWGALLVLRWIVGNAFGLVWALTFLLLKLLAVVTLPVWLPVILISNAWMKRRQA